MAENIQKIIKDTAKETAQEVEGRMGVLLEGIQADVKQVLEVAEIHTKQLKRLEDVPDKLEQIDSRLVAIETTLESVNLPIMKEKISSLEKRVGALEAKFSMG